MSNDPGRLSIGAFSRASSISVRTLRNYHDSGLLVPAAIDPHTGYRSYTVDQLADAHAIVRLRELDVPLAKVHEVLERRDPATTAAVLAEHRLEIEQRLRAAERILEALSGDPAATTTPVHRRTEAPRTVVAVTETVAGEQLWAWLEHRIAGLLELAGERAVAGTPPGALYTPSIEDDGPEQVTAFVEIAEPFFVSATADRAVIAHLPGCTTAALVHPGGFDTIGDTYRLLGAWVGRHGGAHEQERVREYYPALRPGSGPPDTIELRWPLGPST